MMLNGSQILIQSLIDQGVDTIFGYPGGSVLNIYDALYDKKEEIVAQANYIPNMNNTNVTNIQQNVVPMVGQNNSHKDEII